MCSFDGCSKPPRSGSEPLCEGHYGQRRRGVPLSPLKEKVRVKNLVCAVNDCDGEARGTYCVMHYARIRRHGDAGVVIHQRDRALPRGEDHFKWNSEGSYAATHQRLKKVRGAASAQTCACGEPAQQWAYTGPRTPGETEPWSADLGLYVAMCTPCHKVMDLGLLKGTL